MDLRCVSHSKDLYRKQELPFPQVYSFWITGVSLFWQISVSLDNKRCPLVPLQDVCLDQSIKRKQAGVWFVPNLQAACLVLSRGEVQTHISCKSAQISILPNDLSLWPLSWQSKCWTHLWASLSGFVFVIKVGRKKNALSTSTHPQPHDVLSSVEGLRKIGQDWAKHHFFPIVSLHSECSVPWASAAMSESA